MKKKKKLQVFISSTYEDLKKERQKVSESIMLSGHIPAGMEMFIPSDRSQRDIIEKWINDSDILLVIIGGRYGSIHPSSGKSYTQLEVEYAKENKIPVYAIELTEQYLAIKQSDNITMEIYERDTNNPKIGEFNTFKDTFSETLKGMVDSFELISSVVQRSLRQFEDMDEDHYHFKGWVRSDALLESSKDDKYLNERVREIDDNFRSKIINEIDEGNFANKMNHILDTCSYKQGYLSFIDEFIIWSSKQSNIFINEDLQNLLFNLKRSFQEYRGYLSTNFFPHNERYHFYPSLNIDIDGCDMEDQKKFDFHLDIFIKVTQTTLDEITYFIRQSQIQLL